MASASIDELAAELQLSVEGEPGQFDAAAAPGAGACASYRREERLQFRFMAFFQALMAILGALTLLLLVVAGYHVFKQDKDGVNGVLAGVGAIVGGAGTAWLSKQRQDARTAFRAAQKLLRQCP